VHANKAVQNTVEQNKVGGEVITGQDISRRRGRLYYDRGETLLRSRGDFRRGETISRDTGNVLLNKFAGNNIIVTLDKKVMRGHDLTPSPPRGVTNSTRTSPAST